jgi:hypothetical protein
MLTYADVCRRMLSMLTHADEGSIQAEVADERNLWSEQGREHESEQEGER